MPVFHFILHAYRSWNTDHPHGYIQRGEKGTKPRNRRLATARNGMAKSEPSTFNPEEQQFLIEAAQEATTRRCWQLYGATVIENHLHLVIAWTEKEVDELFVQARIKRALGYLIAKRRQSKGAPIFSRGGAPEHVNGRKHLAYLLDEYFPRHNSVLWRHPGL